MTAPADPYRVLGLTADASANEIRSAYRRLAKQYHPDAAGERALPRFLAIQAAYEFLVDGEGRLRGQPSAAGPTPAWAADPDRTRATRDAFRARRRGWGPTGGRAGSGSTAPGSARADPNTSDAGSGRDRRPPGSGSGRRTTRKATPGSTSYDEAAEFPRDPAWQGAGWYGPASGTFWTINPHEYADPRKHGPEYQARARRAAEVEGRPGHRRDAPAPDGPSEAEPIDPGAARTDAEGGEAGWEWATASRGSGATGTSASTTEAGPERWSAGGWSYRPESDDHAGHTGTASERVRAARVGTAPAAEPLPDVESVLSRLGPRSLRAVAARGDPRSRIALALVAWPPLGFGIAWLIGEVSGCASYSASCTATASWASLAAQPLLVALLALVPTVAAIAAFASLATLAVIIPLAAILGLVTVADPGEGRGLLAAAAAITYALALLGGVRWGRRVRADEDRAPTGGAAAT